MKVCVLFLSQWSCKIIHFCTDAYLFMLSVTTITVINSALEFVLEVQSFHCENVRLFSFEFLISNAFDLSCENFPSNFLQNILFSSRQSSTAYCFSETCSENVSCSYNVRLVMASKRCHFRVIWNQEPEFVPWLGFYFGLLRFYLLGLALCKVYHIGIVACYWKLVM